MKHDWARRGKCACGSFIAIDVVGTGWEPYAVQCWNDACSDAFDEYKARVKSRVIEREGMPEGN